MCVCMSIALDKPYSLGGFSPFYFYWLFAFFVGLVDYTSILIKSEE